MKPPYEISNTILSLVAAISEKIGEVNAAHLYKPPTELRKKNRIKTIQSSLEIEGNTLSESQITDLLNNKRIIASLKDIIEVKNAIAVYSELEKLNVLKVKSLLEAHRILMKDLIKDAGKLRDKAVGIVKGDKITHMAPPAHLVPTLLEDLFQYLKNDEDLLLIKSCVFHYEFEFIHPFSDGNGRMGRLWQTLILKKHAPVFEFLPIESLIKERQTQYYGALSKSDSIGKSTPFIEFMLEVIKDALEDLLQNQNISFTNIERIETFKLNIGTATFSRQDYLRVFKNISAPTASRDLKEAVDNGILIKSGDKRNTTYSFK
ncbi:Fic family protein [Lacihabitans lacunae]|uniref:Fic family protein n=1 Tax=Lacihabitans lacunae TaxID=1028214 RepID=A0ABV7YVQ7_9BACT